MMKFNLCSTNKEWPVFYKAPQHISDILRYRGPHKGDADRNISGRQTHVTAPTLIRYTVGEWNYFLHCFILCFYFVADGIFKSNLRSSKKK